MPKGKAVLWFSASGSAQLGAAANTSAELEDELTSDRQPGWKPRSGEAPAALQWLVSCLFFLHGFSV